MILKPDVQCVDGTAGCAPGVQCVNIIGGFECVANETDSVEVEDTVDGPAKATHDRHQSRSRQLDDSVRIDNNSNEVEEMIGSGDNVDGATSGESDRLRSAQPTKAPLDVQPRQPDDKCPMGYEDHPDDSEKCVDIDEVGDDNWRHFLKV